MLLQTEANKYKVGWWNQKLSMEVKNSGWKFDVEDSIHIISNSLSANYLL